MTQPNPFADHPRPLAPVPDDAGSDSEVVETPMEVVSDDGWKHETLEFLGDVLEVRKPTEQALAAYSLASSKYVSSQMRNDMTGLFIARHLSPDSYAQVFSRLMDPDDDAYTIETIGKLMVAVVQLRVAVPQ